ncbi:MAG: universal stress protein [Caldilineales bacterium]|nr:universal stress protein [Caldilineales bacterium]
MSHLAGGWRGGFRLRSSSCISAEPTPTRTKARIDRHLRRGVRSLQALGLQVSAVVEQHETPVSGILRFLENQDFDMIVLGAPASRAPQRMVWSDLAAPIIETARQSVLLVPMRE